MEKHVSLLTSAKCILSVPEAAPPIEYIDSTYSIVDSDARGHKIFEMSDFWKDTPLITIGLMPPDVTMWNF